MKKKILYLTIIMLFSALSVNAQRSWDMGNNTSLWPANSPAFTGTVVVDGLTEVGGTNFGVTGTSTLSWTDGYTSIQEFRSGGSSSGFATNKPTTRFFSFPVTGPTTVKVWFRVNGTGGRKCIISDGTTLLGDNVTSEDNTVPLFLSVNYTGGAGTIYVFSNASINYYKIESTDAPLSTDSFQKESDIAVYADNGKIFLSNVKTNTKVTVYNLLGSLVQSAEINGDTSLNVNNGVYVVKVKSADGEKSVKVIVQ